MVTAQTLRQLLHYDPETGKLTWKSRDTNSNAAWNARYAGKEAGSRNGEGYWQIGVFGRKCYAHRIAWAITYGGFPDGEIDHINGDRTDNRLINLRAVDQGENQRNKALSANNTSGVTGVYWDDKRKKWWAEIAAKGQKRRLGFFNTLTEAAKARSDAEKLHGYHENHGRSD